MKQVRRDIRPRPHTTFRGRSYAAAVSPESSRIMAELGLGLCIIPQKPWDMVAEELATYRGVYRRGERHAEAPAPIVAGWTFCDEDAGPRRARWRERYIGGYWQSVVEHYEILGTHLQTTKGYESYGRMQEIASAPGGADAMTEFFLDLQVWGTPEQCYEKIMTIKRASPAPAPTTACSATPACRTRTPSAACGSSRATCCRACRRSTTCPLGVPRPAAA